MEVKGLDVARLTDARLVAAVTVILSHSNSLFRLVKTTRTQHTQCLQSTAHNSMMRIHFTHICMSTNT